MRDFRHETVPKDLRLKVLAAVDRGMPRKEVAQVFGLSEPTIRRYLRLRRQTGDLEPKPVPGPPARKREALERRLPAQVRLNPELTLTEHCELFEDESGMEVWTATMSRAFVRLELPLKKSPPGIRARRGAEGPLAKRGAPNRGRAPRLRGRVRHAHLHDAPVREGPEGRASLRQGATEPRQEHDAVGEHELGGDGTVPGGGGLYDQGGLRGLRGAGIGAFAAPRASGGDGQPRGAQGGAGEGTHRSAGLLFALPAALLVAGFLADRGGFQQAQGAPEEGQSLDARGARGGHRPGLGSR